MRDASKIDGLYVHVPFCDGKCHYCAFYSVPYTRELGQAWLAAVKHERDQALVQYGRLPLTSIFMGGGTPTILPLDQLEELLALLRGASMAPPLHLKRTGNSILSEGATPVMPDELEWTSEANPGSLTAESVGLMKAYGVNRISLGVQAMNDAVLNQLGRRHSLSDIYAAVAVIQASGITNWGVDLIACIPGVSEAAWCATLESAIRMGPKHVSVYALTREEGTRLNHDCEAGVVALMDDEAQLRMLDLAEALLREAGFNRYEISNYARPGFECRHNLSCWRGENYLGLGCAAASRFGNQRWTNHANLKPYIDGVNLQDRETLTPITDAVERLVFGMRVSEGVDLTDILQITGLIGTIQSDRWAHTLKRLGEESLVECQAGRWRLTSRGRALADYVAVELMP